MAEQNADLLALSDAVLALSIDSINYNLFVMTMTGVIRKRWTLAWTKDEETKETVIHDDEDVLERVENWAETRTKAAEAMADKNFQKFAELYGSIEENFSGAWNATIGDISITVVPNGVLLKIAFSDGELIMPRFDGIGVDVLDMGGVVYAFETKLGQLTVDIGDGSMLPDAEESAKSAIAESGLGSEHFTIESIFMNLQRSNIANFSGVDSELPDGADEPIAVAVSTMFNKAMPEDEMRRYVLGYAVQQKKLVDVEKAIFQPTAISYSVTYAEPDEGELSNPESSFNFHLQVDGDRPVTNQVLPIPLLDGHMANSEIDGVFALRYSLFDDHVLDPIIRPVLRKAVEGFKAGEIKEVEQGTRWQISATRSSKTSQIEFNLKGDTGKRGTKHTNERMIVTAEVRTLDGNLQVDFTIDMKMTVKYEALRMTAVAENLGNAVGSLFKGKKPKKVIQNEEVLMVSSSTRRNGRGIIRVTIKPGALGKLAADPPVAVQDVDLVMDKAKVSPHFGSFTDNFSALFSGQKPVSWLRDRMRNAVKRARVSDRVEEEINKKLEEAANIVQQVNALSVVMPLGNLYTFKELSVRKNSRSKILEATVGYVPLVETQEGDHEG